MTAVEMQTASQSNIVSADCTRTPAPPPLRKKKELQNKVKNIAYFLAVVLRLMGECECGSCFLLPPPQGAFTNG